MLRDLLDLMFGKPIEVETSTFQGRALTIALKQRQGRRFVCLKLKGGGEYQVLIFDRQTLENLPEEFARFRDVLSPWRAKLA